MDVERAQLDLLRRRVINVVGHELRTPVTTLRGLAELLGTTTTADDTATVHESIRRVSRRLEVLVDDLLVAAGVETALPVEEPQPTDLEAAIGAVLAELDNLPDDFEIELDLEPGLAVLARPSTVRRTLRAVLENAMRYGAGPVEVRTGVEGDRVAITVADAGPGIPDADRLLVREPFFRGERAVMTAPGLGLGLAVANDLVHHDGGELDVAAAEQGTVVVITLPVAGSVR